MSQIVDKNQCRKCKKKVGQGRSICRSKCQVWHHLKCSGLSKLFKHLLSILKTSLFIGNVTNVLFTDVGNVKK